MHGEHGTLYSTAEQNNVGSELGRMILGSFNNGSGAKYRTVPAVMWVSVDPWVSDASGESRSYTPTSIPGFRRKYIQLIEKSYVFGLGSLGDTCVNVKGEVGY